MTFRNNRAPLLSNIKPCAWFHHHMWIQTGATVWKRLSGVMASVTLTFDLWSCPSAWTSGLSMLISPENFRMMRWFEHCQKGVTDGRTDKRAAGKKCSYSCLVAAKNNVMWPFVVRHIPLCRNIYFQTWGSFFWQTTASFKVWAFFKQKIDWRPSRKTKDW